MIGTYRPNMLHRLRGRMVSLQGHPRAARHALPAAAQNGGGRAGVAGLGYF
jgi:hypothetical protein